MIAKSWSLFTYWIARYLFWKSQHEQGSPKALVRPSQSAHPSFLVDPLQDLSAHSGDTCVTSKAYLDRMTEVYNYLTGSDQTGSVQTGPNQTGSDQIGSGQLASQSGTRLVTLQAELAFVEAYMYLIQTRLPGRLLIQTEIDPAFLSRKIPARSIQKAIESAMKQNMMTFDSPLQLLIRTLPDGKVQVRNNRQRKIRLSSAPVDALSDVEAQYVSLNGKRVIIEETASQVCVTLPLFPEN